MNKLLIALVAVALPAAAHADADKSGKPPPREARSRPNPCAAFGPGFVPVEGGSTCVKVGGAISIEAGGRR